MTSEFPREVLSDIELRLVSLVARKPRTGREVAVEWRLRTGSDIGDGTMYTTLTKLETWGFVTKTDDLAHGRVRVYRATARGREMLVVSRHHHLAMAKLAAVSA